jgi:hypothetical protein
VRSDEGKVFRGYQQKQQYQLESSERFEHESPPATQKIRVARVCKRTTLTEQLQLVGEVSVNF